MTIERLRETLTAIGPPPAPIELAEMIWLAGFLTTDDHEGELASGFAETSTDSGSDERDHAWPPDRAVSGRKVPVRAASTFPGGSADATAVQIPAAPMLMHPLALQRALRPLKRRIPSRRHRVLDEAATAAQIADRPREYRWTPVLTPAHERWLNLALVIDSGPAMGVWRSLAGELREAMFRLGAFRDVRVWLLADLGDRVGIRASLRGPVMESAALIDTTGRQAVVLLSDCSSPHWWEDRTGPAVHLWAKQNPTAILQPLPARLWRRTAAPAVPGTATLAYPGAPSTGLRFTPHDRMARPPAGTLPVPVIELSADWLADWARLVTASGGAMATAVTYLSHRRGPADEPVIAERDLPIAERVLRFHAAASPEAAELAAHVAVAVPSLPVMQLIQHRIMPGSRPSDLAEVLLSGLLRPVDDVPGLYDFIPGARAELLKTLPRPESLATAKLLEQVAAEIQARARVTARTFPGVIPVGAGTGQLALDPDQRPFALLSTEALSMLHHTSVPAPSQAPPVNRSPARVTQRPDRHTWDDFLKPVGPGTAGSSSDPTGWHIPVQDRPAALLPPVPSVAGPYSKRHAASPDTVTIGLWGSPASGKTTYLAALPQALSSADGSNGNWTIFPNSEASTELLVKWSHELVTERVFPEATPLGQLTGLAWRFVGDLTGSRYARRARFWRRAAPAGSQFDLDLIDVSGEAFGSEQPGKQVASAIADAALDRLAEARGLLLFFDPVTERDRHNAAEYVNRTLTMLSRRVISEGRLIGPYLPHYLAVCITKFDHKDVFQQARAAGLVNYGPDGMPRVLDAQARELFDMICEGRFWKHQRTDSHGGALFVRNQLRRYFHPDRIRYYAVSSIGFRRPAEWDPQASRPGFQFDPENFSNVVEQGGKQRILGPIEPVNVLEPLIDLHMQITGRA